MIIAEVADKMGPVHVALIFDLCMAAAFYVLMRVWKGFVFVVLPACAFWFCGVLNEMCFDSLHESIVRELGVGYVILNVVGASLPLLVVLGELALDCRTKARFY